MSWFLILSYLFFIGSTLGWVLELLYRRFISKNNPERKWINPGFCTGPYLPLYGEGLAILYVLVYVYEKTGLTVWWQKIIASFVMGLFMTALEYIAGLFCLKKFKVRLWDYSKEWGNIQGIICPKFYVYWSLICMLYYVCIHPEIVDGLNWLAENLAFSYVIGFFFGVFTIDVVYSTKLLNKIRKFAEEKKVVVRFENFKMHIKLMQEKRQEKRHFLFAFLTKNPLNEHLKEFIERGKND